MSPDSRFSRSSADDQTRLGSELSGLRRLDGFVLIGSRDLQARIRDETERLAHGIGIGMDGFPDLIGIVRVYGTRCNCEAGRASRSTPRLTD